MYAWVCLTDPENSDIPAFNPAPRPIRWQPDGILDWSLADADDWPPAGNPIMSLTYQSERLNNTLVIGIIIAAICVVAACVFLVVIRNRKKAGNSSNK